MPGEELINVPQDLTLVSDEELRTLETGIVSEYDRVRAVEDPAPADVEYLIKLAGDRDRVRAEFAAREARATQAADAERARVANQLSQLDDRMHGPTPAEVHELEAAAAVDPAAIAKAAAEGATAA